jgi:hypothetical protein
MKLKTCAFATLAAALLPATLFAQTPSLSCRPLDPGNTYIEADEKVIGNQACKIVSASAPNAKSPAPQATTAFAPTPTPTPAPTTTDSDRQVAAAAPSPVPATPADPTADDPGEVTAGPTQIPAGSRIVIAPMGGFETYFAAAVREKKVPIRLTLNKASAQFFVVSTETEWQGFVYGSGGSASWSQNGGSAAHGSAASSTRGLEASIMLLDAKTKDVVWAYEVHKSSHGALLFGTRAARGQQSLAEACAKHLKEFIEKGK